MVENDTSQGSEPENDQEDFEPKASLVLTIIYIGLTAAAFALVYFNDLLARR